MRLSLAELIKSLNNKLAPVYVLAGDEPLQLGEAADSIRLAARKADFTEREVLTVDAHFSWNSLLETAGSLSIFADKKIIDLRVPSGKLGNEGSKALQHYCEVKPLDTLLLVTMGKLSKEVQKSRWFTALDHFGVILHVYELEGRQLLEWLQQRAIKRGLQISPDALKVLAGRIEGNLLAAAQEIEKLYILFGSSLISTEAMLEVIADNARFDVFKLVESVLHGNVKRVGKILYGLRDEGIAAPVVLWAITREIRTLASMHFQLQQRLTREVVYKNHQVWDKRKALINEALIRIKPKRLNEALVVSAKADQQIKGQSPGDPWESLLQICLLLVV